METAPEIEYHRIDYPSDHLAFTLKDWRAGKFDEATLGDMHLWERDFARLGYLREAGVRAGAEALLEEMNATARADVGVSAREHLSAYYTRFGLAEGPETAHQLIRRLEAQGAEQAQQRLGKQPT